MILNCCIKLFFIMNKLKLKMTKLKYFNFIKFYFGYKKKRIFFI